MSSMLFQSSDFLAEATRDNSHAMPYYTDGNDTLSFPSPTTTVDLAGPLSQLIQDHEMSDAPANGGYEEKKTYDPTTALREFEREISPEPPMTPGSRSPRQRVSARRPYSEPQPEEVICVIHRWFSNVWEEKTRILNTTFGWDFTSFYARKVHSLAKRNAHKGWRTVYVYTKFEEIHWWSELITELTKTAVELGISLEPRKEELPSNIWPHNLGQTSDHCWSDKERKILCLLRTTFGDLDSEKTQIVMHALFPDMRVSCFDISEQFRKMKKEEDPFWLEMKDLTIEAKMKKYGHSMNEIHAVLEKIIPQDE